MSARRSERDDEIESLRRELGRLRAMQRLTAELSRVATPDEVGRVVTDQIAEALGADAIAIARLAADGATLEVGRSTGYEREVMDQYQRIPLEVAMPLTEAVRSRRPVFVESLAELARRYPAVPLEHNRHGSRMALPLADDGHLLGAVVISYRDELRFGDDERRMAETVGQLLAQALGRADRYDTEQRARTAAETASQAREDLLAIVSHDLRNPLGSILTSLAMIGRLEVPPPAAEKLRKYTAIIQRSADRMNRWISDLLELALLESGTLSIVRGPVDARTLVRDAVDVFGPVAIEKEIRLDCAFPTDPGTLMVDRDRIVQVLSNLIGNALKYTPSRGEVIVTADVVDGVPTFSVRDTGPGIPPAQVPKIFDRYWQARRQRGAGVGLGLSIAKGLVEAHGGTLRVETAPGAGASFAFTLPRA